MSYPSRISSIPSNRGPARRSFRSLKSPKFSSERHFVKFLDFCTFLPATYRRLLKNERPGYIVAAPSALGRESQVQNWYVGDVGDYVKLAILRALSPGRHLGIAWWLFPDERHKADGRHLSYLDRSSQWRKYDPPLFDALDVIRKRGDRDIRFLEQLLPDARFASELIPSDIQPSSRRPVERQRWFQRVMERLEGANLVFVDPDNGIAPDGFKPTHRKSGKSISLAEIGDLARPNRTLVIYHHQTHRAGGHHDELHYLAEKLKSRTKLRVAGALRARPWSPRAFFILDADAQLIERTKQIAETWGDYITWHPCD